MLGFQLLKVMNIEKSWSIYKFISLLTKLFPKKKFLFFIERDRLDLIDKIKNQAP